ncbi:MAG: NnrU family protein [Rhodoferax sp.]
MLVLVLGLLLFLGTHCLRVGGDVLRDRLIARLGTGRFKGLYAMLSGIGLVLVVWGFGSARETPVVLWSPPPGMRHLTFLLMLMSMVLLAAAYVPRNAIRARLHHPMVLSVKTWALAHLLSNGTLAHVVLFGAFLIWSVALFRASRRRDALLDMQYAAGETMPTFITVGVGMFAWLVLLGWLHGIWIGVRLIA